MTKVFHCAELKEGCTAVIRGENADQIIELAKRHAEKDHGHTEHPEDKVAEVRKRIRDE